ncbi:MAG: family 16 glycosylhydrolase [Clostridia bacterium]|nr:family 16 glycosylhydrolase [Clostridia bacterium]
MKRVLTFVLAMLMCVVLFVGCGGSEGNESNNASVNEGVNNGAFSTEDVKYFDANNDAVYRIVRPQNDEGAGALAGVLFKNIKQKIGATLKNVSDTEDGNDIYEILVGNTNRTETETAKQYLLTNLDGRYNDYIVCTIGKKIVIYSRSEKGMQEACDYFVANFVSANGVKGGIFYTHAADGDFVAATINGVKLGAFTIVKQRYNESYVTVQQVEKANELFVEKTGYMLEMVDDNVVATDYEIIIGDANREGVVAHTNTDEYSVVISGKKVYLNGGSPSARAMAVNEFAKMITSGPVTDGNSVKNASYSLNLANYDTSNFYTKTWYDDFDEPVGKHVTGIDLTKWAFSTEGASAGHNGRNCKRAKTDDMLFVANGMLNFFATYDDKSYYGFKIYTKNMMLYHYGILEMSAILPHGDAFWVALWGGSDKNHSNAAYNSEINVVEMFGNSTGFASNLHGWVNDNNIGYYETKWKPLGYGTHWSFDGNQYGNDKKYYLTEGKFNDDMHTFSYVWDEDICGFACDGNLFFSINPNDQELWKETFDDPMHVILSQATGFASRQSCAPDDDISWEETNNFQIDYVHIYQLDKDSHYITYLK